MINKFITCDELEGLLIIFFPFILLIVFASSIDIPNNKMIPGKPSPCENTSLHQEVRK